MCPRELSDAAANSEQRARTRRRPHKVLESELALEFGTPPPFSIDCATKARCRDHLCGRRYLRVRHACRPRTPMRPPPGLACSPVHHRPSRGSDRTGGSAERASHDVRGLSKNPPKKAGLAAPLCEVLEKSANLGETGGAHGTENPAKRGPQEELDFEPDCGGNDCSRADIAL